MTLLQAVADQPYMIWQLYVQMLNFRDLDIEDKAVILVCLSVGNDPSHEMKKFEKWTKAKVYYYYDERVSKTYISSIRPHVIKKYLRDYPTRVFFYHDQDIIFLSLPNFIELEQGDMCYVSREAASYLDYRNYIKRFKSYQFHTMCHIVGIDPDTVAQNDHMVGGAQYVIKNTDYNFWDKVEKDCEALHRYMEHATKNGIRDFRNDEELPTYHIQIWAADMWAVLWNIWLSGMFTIPHPSIDFCWPTNEIKDAKPILHNAGIADINEYNAETGVRFFRKDRYLMHYPFSEDHSYVPENFIQSLYVKLFKRMEQKQPTRRLKVLGIYNTTNKLHPDLLNLTLSSISRAANNCEVADVKIVTCSWQPIPGSQFKGYITPFRDLGHLNYVLQMKQILVNEHADIVCILEHDMMYPPTYFTRIVEAWDGSKYGVIDENYIGVNQTGWVDVIHRHQPFSVMSMAKFYLEQELNRAIDECLKNIDNSAPYGWCYVEPHNKSDFKVLPFTNSWPCVHFNMNQLGAYGTGAIGKNHHFTSHAEVCYAPSSNGKLYRDDWGDYKTYFTFN
jgi:hypothetical protein